MDTSWPDSSLARDAGVRGLRASARANLLHETLGITRSATPTAELVSSRSSGAASSSAARMSLVGTLLNLLGGWDDVTAQQLAGRPGWQAVDQPDPARILVGRDAPLGESPQFLRVHGRAAAQYHGGGVGQHDTDPIARPDSVALQQRGESRRLGVQVGVGHRGRVGDGGRVSGDASRGVGQVKRKIGHVGSVYNRFVNGSIVTPAVPGAVVVGNNVGGRLLCRCTSWGAGWTGLYCTSRGAGWTGLRCTSGGAGWTGLRAFTSAAVGLRRPGTTRRHRGVATASARCAARCGASGSARYWGGRTAVGRR